MTNRFLNIFPIGGASFSGASAAYINLHAITWTHLGEIALEVAVAALVGGVIGWGVKHALDHLLKKIKYK